MATTKTTYTRRRLPLNRQRIRLMREAGLTQGEIARALGWRDGGPCTQARISQVLAEEERTGERTTTSAQPVTSNDTGTRE
jgi:DNA-binding transcriptional MerR regulator